MKATRFMGLAAVAAAAVACFALTADELKAGATAPSFSGATADGKTFSLEGALKDKPVFVYFISTSCPVSKAATPHYNALAKTYASQGLSVVGVVNGDKAAFDRWNATHKVPYPVVLDPDYKVIKSWTGSSTHILVETNELAAKAVGNTATNLEFAGAPASWQAG